MNVEFRCPNCHSRHFLPPAGGKGSIARKTCTHDECAMSTKGNRLVQHEEFGGVPDAYNFVDENRQIHYTHPDEARMAGMGEEEKRLYLRERIKEVTGKSPDGRLGADSLTEELFKILDEQQPLATDTSARDGAPEDATVN